MNRVSLAGIRILFFIMLFVTTACNKIDRNLVAYEPASDAVMAAETAKVDEARIAALSARVQYLEAELSRVSKKDSAASDIPGGVTWD